MYTVCVVTGQKNIVWPGLNAPVVKGREVVSIKPLPPDPDRETKIREIRDRGLQFRSFKVPALQRGWTGAKRAGTSIGPPDPVGDCRCHCHVGVDENYHGDVDDDNDKRSMIKW